MIRRLRIASQTVFLIVFLYLLTRTQYAGVDEIRLPVRILLEIDPLDAYSYLHIGRAYADIGGKENKEKAQRYYDLAREIDPYDDNLEDLLLFQSKKTQREFR